MLPWGAMSNALMTVEEYLAQEHLFEVDHDYLAGRLYARSEASEAHCTIVVNLCAKLHSQLLNRACRPFGPGMKVKFRPTGGDTYFYYPDAMVACDPTDSGYSWRERPSVLFEITSEETRQIDEREKRLVYRQLPSLQAYVRIEQSRAEVVAESRTATGWKVEHCIGLEAVLRLPQPAIELPLAGLYEFLTFPPASAPPCRAPATASSPARPARRPAS